MRSFHRVEVLLAELPTFLAAGYAQLGEPYPAGWRAPGELVVMVYRETGAQPMAFSRPFDACEAFCQCACGHVLVARPGDGCPRCKRVLVHVGTRTLVVAMVRAHRTRGRQSALDVAHIAGVAGRLVVRDDRVLGVVA